MARSRSALAWIAVGFALALTGCGDVSLLDALKGDSPGALRISPTTALVPLNTSFTMFVLGGIYPYDLAASPSPVLATSDVHVLEFPALSSISGNSQDFPIAVTDQMGDTVTASVKVYSALPLALDFSALTLVEGSSWTFHVTGGLDPYAWAEDDIPVDPPPAPDTDCPFVGNTAGSYVLSVIDSLGVSRAATVTVVASTVGSGALTISPQKPAVVPGGQLAFTALGGKEPPFYAFSPKAASATAPGFFYPTANPSVYTAPSAPGKYTVTLTNGKNTVSTAVTISSSGEVLTLSPDSPTVPVGGQVQFIAKGGTTPYAFSCNKPEVGFIDPSTGLYTLLSGGNTVVTVRDYAGLSQNTVVKWVP